MNDTEQAAYDHLTQTHATFKQMGMEDDEILQVAKTNGNMPWKAICKYCDDHNEQHPDWPEFVRF